MKIGHFLQISIFTVCCSLAYNASAQSKTESEKNLTAFPAAPAGSERYVIHLPPLDEEQHAKVEIIAGRIAMVDCNISWFTGNLNTSTIDGWGFDYYTLAASDHMISTRMACPQNSSHKAFVPVRGNNFMLRYNSRLPIVIYAKDGFEIRYRIWKPLNDTHSAQRG